MIDLQGLGSPGTGALIFSAKDPFQDDNRMMNSPSRTKNVMNQTAILPDRHGSIGVHKIDLDSAQRSSQIQRNRIIHQNQRLESYQGGGNTNNF